MNKVLLIIPAYNEEASIESTIKKVIEARNNLNLGFLLDYIVINDGSTDKTETILESNKYNHIKLIRNLGIGGAVQTGYKYAKSNNFDIAVQFDGDGQHDLKSLSNLVLPVINNECDFCVGTRFGSEKSEFISTPLRRLGIRYLSLLIKILTFGKFKISDPTSGFRAANKQVIEVFSSDYPVDYPEPETLMTLWRKKLKVTEASVNMLERAGGESSIHFSNSFYYMIKVSLAIVADRLVKK